MAGIEDVFIALFFGAGSWLGLLIYLAIIIGLLTKIEYAGALLLPVTIFLGIAYIEYDLAWHAIVMLFLSVFIVIYTVKKSRR